MKKRVLSFCLCGIMLLLTMLTACDKNPIEPSDTDATTVTDQQSEVTTQKRIDKEPADMPHDEKLLINGVNITSYRIVYGRSPLTYKFSNTGKTVADDIGQFLQGTQTACDFDYQTAMRLHDLIKQYYGYDVEVVKDSDTTEESRYEILVGYTDRSASTQAKAALKGSLDHYKFGSNPYAAATSKRKTQYLICGGSYSATWRAVDEIATFLQSNQSAASADLSTVKQDNGSYDFKVIACVGDSITRGSQALPQGDYGNNNSLTAKFGNDATAFYFEEYLGYPATLQREMWKDAIVYNFGRGGSTMRNYGNGAYYAGSSQFQNCLDVSNSDVDFDLVIMMHGTNDIAWDGGVDQWDAAKKDDFAKELKNQIDKIKAGSPNAIFVVNNTPHATSELKSGTSATGRRCTAIRILEKNIVKDLKSQGYNIYHYDMNQFMIENLGHGCSDNVEYEKQTHRDFYNVPDNNLTDPLHPNYRGYGVIANGMMDLVNYILNGAAAPKYMINIG